MNGVSDEVFSKKDKVLFYVILVFIGAAIIGFRLYGTHSETKIIEKMGIGGVWKGTVTGKIKQFNDGGNGWPEISVKVEFGNQVLFRMVRIPSVSKQERWEFGKGKTIYFYDDIASPMGLWVAQKVAKKKIKSGEWKLLNIIK